MLINPAFFSIVGEVFSLVDENVVVLTSNIFGLFCSSSVDMKLTGHTQL